MDATTGAAAADSVSLLPFRWDVGEDGWSDDEDPWTDSDNDCGDSSRGVSSEASAPRSLGSDAAGPLAAARPRGTRSRARACPCCGCTEHNYRRKFFETYASGYPSPGTWTFRCGGPSGFGRCPRATPPAPSPLAEGRVGLARERERERALSGKATRDMTVDHIVPQALARRASGTPLARIVGSKVHCVRNLVPMCRGCNSSKNDRFGAAELAARALPPRGRMWIAAAIAKRDAP